MMEPVAYISEYGMSKLTSGNHYHGKVSPLHHGERAVPLVRLSDADARIKELEALLKEAVEALEPFAAIGAELDKSSKPDDHNVWGFNGGMATYGDFRAARSIADKIGARDE